MLEPSPSPWMDKESLEACKKEGEEEHGSSKKTRPSREATANSQLDCVVEQDGGTGHQGSAAGSHPGKGQEQEQGGQTAQHSHQGAQEPV